MNNLKWYVVFWGMIFLLCGCAGLGTQYEKPVVGVSSFRLLPSEGVAPRFEIGLHIVNPNRTPLTLKGIYYTVSIEDHRVLAGVSNNLPEVAAYGEEDVALTATVDLVGGIILFGDLVNKPQDSFNYSFKAKLDVGELFSNIVIHEKGVISLSNSQN